MLAGLGSGALARQAMSALQLVVHLSRAPGQGHRVSAIGRLELRDERLAVRVEAVGR